MTGEVNAGQGWKQGFGEGWVFRLLPIEPGKAGYSGWDLVVDRDPPAGFPDALLLATPPYDSINQREVGTTFGVRAQDAIGWNPRSFRFLTDATFFGAGQLRYRRMLRNAQPGGVGRTATEKSKSGSADTAGRLEPWMEEVLRRSSTGQFRILDARLAPGIADAPPFGQNWAVLSARTAHTIEPAPGGKPTPLGSLHWIRFSLTLWLPGGWKAPKKLDAARSPCSE
jgi:hypothetical protein